VDDIWQLAPASVYPTMAYYNTFPDSGQEQINLIKIDFEAWGTRSLIWFIIKGWNPFMGMTSMSVCLSVRPPPVTFERFNIFESRFLHITYAVICRFKFIFISKSNRPFRSTVKGHMHMNYEVRIPSCEVSLERSCQELSNAIQLMDLVTVIWPAGTSLRSTKYHIIWGVVGKVFPTLVSPLGYTRFERFI
jgi:hypothetical protein